MSGIWCSPLILGGAIAFILNVPMHALENRLFGKLKERGKAKKIARPASLALSILFVIIVIWIVLVVLIPEIGSTFTSLSRQIEVAIPKMEQWLTETFQNNDLIEEQINAVFSSLEFNWDRIIETGIDFSEKRCGECAGHYFQCCYDFDQFGDEFCYRFCLCVLYPFAEGKTVCADPESTLCFLSRQGGAADTEDSLFKL